jgi:hypothetical protein
LCTLISIIWNFCSFSLLPLYLLLGCCYFLLLLENKFRKRLKFLYLSFSSFFLLLNIFHYNFDRILISIRNPCQQHLTRDHNNCVYVTIALSKLIRKPSKNDTKAQYVFFTKVLSKMQYESPVKSYKKQDFRNGPLRDDTFPL